MKKFLIVLALLVVASGSGFATLTAIIADNYSQVAFNGASSFLFFHLAVMVIKIGLMPWRVVPTFFLISGMHGASAIEYVFDEQWINAIGQTMVCVAWLIATKQANKTRLLFKELENESN